MISDEALLNEDARYRLLLGAITDYAIYMLNPDGTVASWNPGAQRFKGYRREEILGQHFSRFYTEEDRATGLPARALLTADTKGRFEAEGWRVRKDGSRFWAHVVIDPIRGEDGGLLGFAKVTRDLSERREAELALRHSEDQFRRLVLGVTDYALYMLNPEGLVSNWNPGAERIKGYKPDEIVGQSFAVFYTPEDRAAGEPQRALAIARREGRYEREGWRVRRDGTRFLAHVVIDAIQGDLGEIIGFAKITRDITSQVKAREELERAREQLFQSQKLEAIGQLTGGVAHDFNNLLMAVMGSLELLAKRLPDDPQARRLLDNAREGARRGATLTSRMLSYARRQDLKVGPTDLVALVTGMQDLLQRSVGPEHRLDCAFGEGLDPVSTDAVQLETALLNLVVNARDAMPNGGQITIGTRPAVGISGAPAVGIYVRDEGEGMDAATLARATEPFFTTKGVGKGTGLGLSMVQGLAEQSGGQLKLVSSPGAGTTIELVLPIATEAPAAVAAVPPAQQAAPRHLVILSVDDDPLVLMNTTAMLEDLGHVVVDALSGAEALERLKQHAVDLVITDHAMPVMNGSQLADAIRAQHPNLPVILATGYAELPPGGNDTLPRLSKPFSQQDLARAVARFGPA